MLVDASAMVGLAVVAAALVSYVRGISEKSFLIGAGVVLVGALPALSALAIVLLTAGPIVALVLAGLAWHIWSDPLPVSKRRSKAIALGASAVAVGWWWASTVLGRAS